MCAKDKRDAIPSWNGYEYQGQIAIIAVLEMLCKLKDEGKESDIEEYYVAVEDIEDFSIYKETEIISTHQVKANIGKNRINHYREALYYMAKVIKEKSKLKAYLHTTENLNYEDWQGEVFAEIHKFLPEQEKIYNEMLINEEKLKHEVSEIKTRLNDDCKIKGTASKARKDIFNNLEDIKAPEDITSEKLKVAIEKYIIGLDKLELEKEDIDERILLYKYQNKNDYISSGDTQCYIEELINRYWGEGNAKLREGSVKYYYFRLRDIIINHVSERHMNPSVERKIGFSKFTDELEKRELTTEEQKLFDYKEMLINQIKKHCIRRRDRDCKSKDCEICDLEKVKNWISDMTQGKLLKRVLYMLSPNVNEPLRSSPMLLDRGINLSVIPTLREVLNVKNGNDGKIIYDLEQSFLLTSIIIESEEYIEEEVYECIVDNPVIEEICDEIESEYTAGDVCVEILKNRDFGPVRMEIDSIIVHNKDEPIIEDIEKRAKNILDLDIYDENKIPSYMKITNKRKVSMIHTEEFRDKWREQNEL